MPGAARLQPEIQIRARLKVSARVRSARFLRREFARQAQHSAAFCHFERILSLSAAPVMQSERLSPLLFASLFLLFFSLLFYFHFCTTAFFCFSLATLKQHTPVLRQYYASTTVLLSSIDYKINWLELRIPPAH